MSFQLHALDRPDDDDASPTTCDRDACRPAGQANENASIRPYCFVVNGCSFVPALFCEHFGNRFQKLRHVNIIIIAWLDPEWTLPFPRVTSMQKAHTHVNTSAEMSQIARQANAGKLGGRKPDNSLE